MEKDEADVLAVPVRLIVLERVELHRTNVANEFIDFWSNGDITIHEVYNDSNSPFDIDRTGYHVMMSIRGSDVDKLRQILNSKSLTNK